MTGILATAVFFLGQAVSTSDVVRVSPPEPVTLALGARTNVPIQVKVREGFHVQANPASETYLVPLRLEMEADLRIKVGEVLYPPGKPYRLQGTDTDLATYEGTFRIRLPLEAAAEGPSGELTLEGSLRYQACNDRICLRPASVPLSLTVKLVQR